MSLKKLHVSKMEPIKGDHYADHKDEVTYTSVNDRNQTVFSAVTAPNSRHAARLAQLAIAVQNKEKTRERGPKMPALIGSSPGSRQQIEYRSETSKSESHRTASFEAQRAASVAFTASAGHSSSRRPPQHGQGICACCPQALPVMATPTTPVPVQQEYTTVSYSDVPHQASPVPQQIHQPVIVPATRMEYVEGLGYIEVEIQTVASPAPRHREQQVARPVPASCKAPEVTHYTTDEKTGYKVKGGSGKLEVSAPHGSTEAWVFDEFAKANSQQDRQQNHGHERRLAKRNHHSSSHSGGGFWQWVRQ